MEFNDAALQKDGKIVIVGTFFEEYPGFALLRLHSNGSLDRSFDGDGKLVTKFGNGSHRGMAITLQSDGKLVAGGYYNGNYAIARYLPNGSLDPSFSDNGKQTTDFGGSESIASVAVQEDGKIIAGGGIGRGTLARFKMSGRLDSTFSNDGKQVTGFEDGIYEFRDIAVSGDRLYAVGGTVNGGHMVGSGVVAAYRLGSGPVQYQYVLSNDHPGEFAQTPKITTRQAEPVIHTADGIRLDISASPNPTSQSFSVRVHSVGEEVVTVRLFDSEGKILHVQQAPLTKGSVLQLGHNWRPGVYYLEAVQGTRRKAIKLVKTN